MTAIDAIQPKCHPIQPKCHAIQPKCNAIQPKCNASQPDRRTHLQSRPAAAPRDLPEFAC